MCHFVTGKTAYILVQNYRKGKIEVAQNGKTEENLKQLANLMYFEESQWISCFLDV